MIPSQISLLPLRACQQLENKYNFFMYSYSILRELCAVIRLLTNSQRASLKGLHATLFILKREEPLSSINALPLSLLSLAVCDHTYLNWYNYFTTLTVKMRSR